MLQFSLHTLIVANLWLPVLLGWNLLFGKGKVFHFGPFGTWAATAYAVTIPLVQTGNPYLAILSGAIVAVLVSAIFAWLSFRLEPDGLGVMTLAVHLAILALILNWTDLTRGALGIPGVPRFPFMQSMEAFALVTTCVSLLFIGFFLWLSRGPFGRQIEALAEHEWYAKSIGINRVRVHFLAFLILGIAGISSSLFTPQYLHLLHPNEYQFPSFIFLVMMVVAGKPGNLWGGVAATVLLIILREALRFVPLAPDVLGPLRLLLFGVILFIAVWWRRDVLFPHQRSV